MLRVGLTGGIGCGKSAVAAMFRELGCLVIEADPIAHQLIEPGQPAYAEVVEEFGSTVLRPDRSIDRQKLAAIVFADPAKLARLNKILHPRVIAEVERWLAKRERSDAPAFAIIEAALLIEGGYHTRMDRLVVVWCRPEQQRERLRARGMAPAEIDRRIAAQMPLEEKRRLADDQIDCSGSIEQTRSQVERLAANLRGLTASQRAASERRHR